MKKRQVLTRLALADQLVELAGRLRAGQSVAIGGAEAKLPERVSLEAELEVTDGKGELELEIEWPVEALGATPLVGILTGSPNDLEVVLGARDALATLGVPCEVRVLSAHRTPDETVAYVKAAEGRGIEVLIACAGMANHLAGVVAANTALPVIGVPLASGKLGGFDALLSTVQMPPGVPVATVAVDGAKNAGILAARILALKYPELRTRLDEVSVAERARYDRARVDAEVRAAAEPKAKGGPATKPVRGRR